jgi:hypothetical protein
MVLSDDTFNQVYFGRITINTLQISLTTLLSLSTPTEALNARRGKFYGPGLFYLAGYAKEFPDSASNFRFFGTKN